MNTHTKGLRSQRKAKEWLYSQGYKYVYIIQHSRWSKDISFPLSKPSGKLTEAKFDGFALKDGRVTFIQIKTNKMPNLQPYIDFKNEYYCRSLIIVVNDYGEIQHRYIGSRFSSQDFKKEIYDKKLEVLAKKVKKWR